MVSESFTKITLASWAYVIHLIKTEDTIWFGHDTALAHPLFHTEEYMIDYTYQLQFQLDNRT